MCCLFGIYNYSGKEIKCLSKITNSLAKQATERGIDATGIAYNDKGCLIIHKEPKDARCITFKHPDNVKAVMGHTRHTTQGNEKRNYNNHPFAGKCKNLKFALAHNGVLFNDKELRKSMHLPRTKIETDSYIAVQLIEKKRYLNSDSIKYMAERIEGSFSFSILDEDDTLWLVKGDSPLAIVHLPKQKLYIYASTAEILYKALVDTELFEEIKKANFEEIDISEGDILSINPTGTLICNHFDYLNTNYYGYNWWNYKSSKVTDNTYLDDLKTVANCYGYDPNTIDDLFQAGFTPDEIEEYIYCME